MVQVDKSAIVALSDAPFTRSADSFVVLFSLSSKTFCCVVGDNVSVCSSSFCPAADRSMDPIESTCDGGLQPSTPTCSNVSPAMRTLPLDGDDSLLLEQIALAEFHGRVQEFI